MLDIKKLSEEEKERLIEKYSYYCSDSIGFVRDNLKNYIEIEYILDNIVKNIKNMQNEYKIHYSKDECGLSLENKKTKESYSIRIEF